MYQEEQLKKKLDNIKNLSNQIQSQQLPPKSSKKPEGYEKKKQQTYDFSKGFVNDLQGKEDNFMSSSQFEAKKKPSESTNLDKKQISKDQDIQKFDQIIKLLKNFQNLKSYLQEIYSTSMVIIEQKNEYSKQQEIQIQKQKHLLITQQLELEELNDKNTILEEQNEDLLYTAKETKENEQQKRFSYFDGKIYSTDNIDQLNQQQEIQQERLQEINEHFYKQKEAAQADRTQQEQEQTLQNNSNKKQNYLLKELQEQHENNQQEQTDEIQQQQQKIYQFQSVQHEQLKNEVESLALAMQQQQQKHQQAIQKLRDDNEQKTQRKIQMVSDQLEAKEQLQNKLEEQITYLNSKIITNKQQQTNYRNKNFQLLLELQEKDVQANKEREELQELKEDVKRIYGQQQQQEFQHQFLKQQQEKVKHVDESIWNEEEQKSVIKDVREMMMNLQDIQASVNTDNINMTLRYANDQQNIYDSYIQNIQQTGESFKNDDSRIPESGIFKYNELDIPTQSSGQGSPLEQQFNSQQIETSQDRIKNNIRPTDFQKLQLPTPAFKKFTSDSKIGISSQKKNKFNDLNISYASYFKDDEINSELSEQLSFNQDKEQLVFKSAESKKEEIKKKFSHENMFTFVNEIPQIKRKSDGSTNPFAQKEPEQKDIPWEQLCLSQIEPDAQRKKSVSNRHKYSMLHNQKQKIVKKKYKEYQELIDKLEQGNFDTSQKGNNELLNSFFGAFGFLNGLINQRELINDSLITKSISNIKSQKLSIINKHGKLKIEIVDYTIKNDCPTFYQIQITDKLLQLEWNVVTRYSELRKIHMLLKEEVEKNEQRYLPKFPSSYIFSSKQSKQFQNQRSKELNDYFYDLFILKPQFVDKSIYNDFFTKKLQYQKRNEFQDLRNLLSKYQKEFEENKYQFIKDKQNIFVQFIKSIHDNFQSDIQSQEVDEAYELISLQQIVTDKDQAVMGMSCLNHSKLEKIYEYDEWDIGTKK